MRSFLFLMTKTAELQISRRAQGTNLGHTGCPVAVPDLDKLRSSSKTESLPYLREALSLSQSLYLKCIYF